MLPRAEWSNEEPDSQNPMPRDALVHHLFPEGREQHHERQKSSWVASSCVILSLTAAATDLVTTDWGKAAPFSSSHHYVSSQLQLAATFLPDFRSGDLCVFPLLSLARETKLSLTSLKREVQWLLRKGERIPTHRSAHPTQIIPDNFMAKMKLNS